MFAGITFSCYRINVKMMFFFVRLCFVGILEKF